MNILNALRKEENKLAGKLKGITAAIAALGGKQKRKGRKMSAAARRKISATQKANWAAKRKNRK
jgi:hypothetical protein